MKSNRPRKLKLAYVTRMSIELLSGIIDKYEIYAIKTSKQALEEIFSMQR